MKWKLLGLVLAKSSDHSRLGNNVVFCFGQTAFSAGTNPVLPHFIIGL